MLSLLLAATGCQTHSLEFNQTDQKFVSKLNGRDFLTYWFRAPQDSGLPVESGDFFHPLTTPSGVVVTDLAPEDHRHHRGLFIGWVEMHGEKDADFWGWGAHAPVHDRKIVNRQFKPRMSLDAIEFDAENDWLAEGTALIHEKLHARGFDQNGVRVLDLVYQLTPANDLTLSRWAFGGFCLRVRKEGDIRIFSPDGPVHLPSPNYLKPESDWPDAAWYGCEQTLSSGRQIGAAVINHPDNPPTLWHNPPDIRMINPCIVAPAELKLPAGKPLVLRYRVVTFDGSLPSATIDRLARDWRTNTQF